MHRRCRRQRGCGPAGRRAAVIRALSVVLALVAGSRVAFAQRPGFNHLDHIIDQGVFDAIVQTLVLSEAQAAAAILLRDQYSSELGAVSDELAAALAAISARPRDETIARLSPEDLAWRAERSNAADRAVAAANQEADVLLESLYAKLEGILADDQRDRLPQVRRLVRRMNKLGGERIHNLARFSYYFDLIDVVRAASVEGGELRPLMADPAAALPDDVRAARAAVDAALLEYELRMDDVLIERQRHRRRIDHREADDMLVSGEDRRGRATIDRWAAEWCRLFRATDEPAGRIAQAVAEALGEDAARRWVLRYWRAWDENLFRDMPLDGAETWLAERREALGDDLHRALSDMLPPYAARLDELRLRAFEAAARVRCHSYSVYGNDGPQLQYADAVFDLMAWHARTLDRMAALLDEKQAEAFRKAFDDPQVLSEFTRDMTIHVQILHGLIDPATYRVGYVSPYTNVWVERRLVRDPETGIWDLGPEEAVKDR